MPTPKVWPVADSAWQIRLPLPWALTSVNVFVFRRQSEYLLLDCGIRWDESLLSLEAALVHVGADWTSISEILVSHLHPDHVGAAAEIRRRSSAPVRMPATEAQLVRPLGPDREFFDEAALFLRRNGVPCKQVERMRRDALAGQNGYERLIVNGHIDNGELIAFDGGTLEAVPAPGHSPAQVCFYCEQQRVLWSSDAILPRVTPNIGVHWFYRGDPLGDYMGTLDRLEKLDVNLVVPSHGKPFVGHREWIEGTRRHHVRRCETILEAMAGNPVDAYRIAGRVWGDDRSSFDRRAALSEALAHLEYMARYQRVERVDIDGVAHWRRT